MPDDESLLRTLRAKLSSLVDVLALDPGSQWGPKFQDDLAQCQRLLSEDPSRLDVITLASSIMSVYQGLGSFNDYAPGSYDASTGRYTTIAGAEHFDSVSRDVFDVALALRSR